MAEYILFILILIVFLFFVILLPLLVSLNKVTLSSGIKIVLWKKNIILLYQHILFLKRPPKKSMKFICFIVYFIAFQQ